MKVGAYNIIALTDAQIETLEEAFRFGWDSYIEKQKDVKRIRVAHRARQELLDALSAKGKTGCQKNGWGRFTRHGGK